MPVAQCCQIQDLTLLQIVYVSHSCHAGTSSRALACVNYFTPEKVVRFNGGPLIEEGDSEHNPDLKQNQDPGALKHIQVNQTTKRKESTGIVRYCVKGRALFLRRDIDC